MLALSQWGERHLPSKGPRRLFHHVACGTRLDVVSYCAVCGKGVPIEQVEVHPGPGLDEARRDRVSLALRTPHRLLAPIADKMG